MLAHTLLILTILFLFLYIIILYFDTSIPMARRIVTKKNPITKKKKKNKKISFVTNDINPRKISKIFKNSPSPKTKFLLKKKNHKNRTERGSRIKGTTKRSPSSLDGYRPPPPIFNGSGRSLAGKSGSKTTGRTIKKKGRKKYCY